LSRWVHLFYWQVCLKGCATVDSGCGC
jgi:hypothetical protein